MVSGLGVRVEGSGFRAPVADTSRRTSWPWLPGSHLELSAIPKPSTLNPKP